MSACVFNFWGRPGINYIYIYKRIGRSYGHSGFKLFEELPNCFSVWLHILTSNYEAGKSSISLSKLIIVSLTIAIIMDVKQ